MKNEAKGIHMISKMTKINLTSSPDLDILKSSMTNIPVNIYDTNLTAREWL